MEAFLTALLIVGLIVLYGSFSWGFVASKFYGWFILPVFPTLPHFTITEFIGFMLFINVMTHKGSSQYIDKKYRDEISEWIIMILSPWLTLFIGWSLHSIFF